ncbi:MAG TPA: oligosaccharide flippase family protein [Candidatus Rifleibacterium sp.]|nr:oligosaccharide flippase family protein [Candidatus Rifleibacterium sp.]
MLQRIRNIFKKQTFQNFSLYFFLTLIQKAFSFLLIPVYLYFLSVEDYGILAITNAIATIVPMLFFLSLHEKIYFDAISKPEDFSLRVSTLIISGFFISIAVVVLQILLLPFADSLSLWGIPFYPHLFLSMITGIGSFFIALFTNILKGENNASKVTLFSISHFAFTTLLSLYLLVIKHLSVLSFLLAYSFGNAIFSAIIIFLLLRKHGYSFSRNIILEMVRFSLPLIPHNMAHWLKASIDKIWTTTYLGLREAGFLQLTTQIVSVLTFAVEAFISTNNPRFINLLDNRSPSNRIVVMLPVSVFFLLIPSLFIAFFSKEMLILIAKPQFTDAGPLFPFFIVSILFHLIYCNTVPLLFRIGSTASIGKITLVSTAISSAFSFILISNFGLIGAGISNILHTLLMAVLVFITCQKRYNLPWKLKRTAMLSFLPLIATVTLFLLPEASIFIRLTIVLLLLATAFFTCRNDLKQLLE